MKESRYYERLIDMVRAYDSPYNRYSRLLDYLYSREFYWSVDNDGNRADDALTLRGSLGYHDFSKPANVLEMMISLADRCEHDVVGADGMEDQTSEWFWSMIENLGLSEQTDDHYDERLVKRRIDMMLDRQYDSHGRYGLFYVKYPPADMRDVELWYQMNWYLSENYIIRDDKEMRRIAKKIRSNY